MTAPHFTGSRWSHVARNHYPAAVHHCATDTCCTRRIDAAEDAQLEDWGDEADGRAEWEAGR